MAAFPLTLPLPLLNYWVLCYHVLDKYFARFCVPGSGKHPWQIRSNVFSVSSCSFFECSSHATRMHVYRSYNVNTCQQITCIFSLSARVLFAWHFVTEHFARHFVTEMLNTHKYFSAFLDTLLRSYGTKPKLRRVINEADINIGLAFQPSPAGTF